MTTETKVTTPPPPSNTGVEKKVYPEPCFSIDYFRYTAPPNVPASRLLMTHRAFEYYDEFIPLRGYSVAYDRNLARVDTSPGSDTQGSMVTMSGSDLMRQYTEYGLAANEVIKFALDIPQVKIKRIDLAMDVFERPGSPMDLANMYNNGEVKTKAKGIQIIQDIKDFRQQGCTVYLGSRTSQLFMRVYDKGAQKDTDFPWLRVEMECKGDSAQAVSEAIVEHGIIAVTKETIRRFADTGVRWIDENVRPEAPGRLIRKSTPKQTDWEKWLNDIVVPNMLKAIDNGIEWAIEAVRQKLDYYDIS